MEQNRQLAAIMFTDIVGYTALMGNDEQKAFRLLKRNRELQRPIIEQHHGRWIKELGDGVLASFHTASDAVSAAIKIQQASNTTNDFLLRIGIHLGEVVFENGDVFGDGVNIASRIQAAADPGAIFVSEAVHHNVQNKNDIETKYVRTEHLKNVKEPVRIYQVVAEGVRIVPAATKSRLTSGSLILAGIVALLVVSGYLLFLLLSRPSSARAETIDLSIAVLPFVNMSGDTTQEYFSDGTTETIITELGQIPGLSVISWNSVFEFKKKTVNPVEIGDLLNVHYVLHGSLLRSGDVLRVNVQLLDARKGNLVWSDKFDRTMKDIFIVMDDISGRIVDSLNIALAIKKKKALSHPTESLEAFDLYLRGHYLFRKFGDSDRKMIDSAIVLFEKAVALDTKFALAYASIGKAYTSIFFNYDPLLKWESKAYVAIEKALSLDPALADAYLAKGNLTWTLSNGFPHERAIKELKHALHLNPNLTEAHESLGGIYFHIGLFDKSLNELRTSMNLDPASRFTPPRIARVHWYQQKYDSALAEFNAIGSSGWYREHALVLWYLGKTDEAFQILEKYEKVNNQEIEPYDLAAIYAVLYAGVGRHEESKEKIRFAIEHGEGISHFHHAEHLIASAFALMGNATEAVNWLQKASDHGFPCYPLFSKDPNFNRIRTDPEFVAFIEKLKKQWELQLKDL